tara:strand:+ start:2282 stop:3331 length:1050 start_codon:yes stop_codon:yes gene_type:complete
MKIKINKKLIFSDKGPPKIIAEISANHCGNKNKFLNLIRLAHNNGADLIKIQTYQPEDIVINSKNKIYKIKEGLWKNKYLWDLYKQAQTPYKWHEDAFKLANKIGATLFSTPFSVRAVKFLEKHKVKLYKIASLENTDVKLIDTIAKTRKPIIISTGASNFNEIKEALKIINRYHNKVVILHCVSAYPTSMEEANLYRIIKLKKTFKSNIIGLSDHTNSIDSSLASIPLGASVIEKHFKDNKRNKSPDTVFSILPRELRVLKHKSELYFNASKSNDNKDTNKADQKNSKSKRSIFALNNIKKNEKISQKNIISLRPKIGISAKYYFKIIGNKVKNNIKKGNPIHFSDLV